MRSPTTVLLPGSLRRVALLAIGCVLLFAQGGTALEARRPLFHYSPAANWMSDPDGLVFYDGEYHLFYQYNPQASHWGHMSWGHAVSPDLVRWHELPVAIPESDIEIWSGSVVVDQQNSSGLAHGRQPAMVAIFTGSRPSDHSQAQYLAYSIDKGRTWTRDGTAPVLDVPGLIQRDPKVFWHKASRRWVMVLARADAGEIALYNSIDLHHWDHVSDFADRGATKDTWECPDLFEMPIEGGPAKTRWVMSVSANARTPADGGNVRYWVGTFDGQRFVSDSVPGAAPAWMNYGGDFYAAASWNGILATDGRRIEIAWASNFYYGSQMPATPARGVMSLPRVLALRRTRYGYRISQSHVSLADLRTTHELLQSMSLSSKPAALPIVGGSVELEIEVEVGSARQITLTIADNNGGRLLFGIDVIAKSLFVDRTYSGPSIGEHFLTRHDAPISIENGKVKFQVVFDQSIIEVFGAEGTSTITDRVFPASGTLDWSVAAVGGVATLKSLNAWELGTSLDRSPK